MNIGMIWALDIPSKDRGRQDPGKQQYITRRHMAGYPLQPMCILPFWMKSGIDRVDDIQIKTKWGIPGDQFRIGVDQVEPSWMARQDRSRR